LEVHGITKFENNWHDKPEVFTVCGLKPPNFSLTVWWFHSIGMDLYLEDEYVGMHVCISI